MIPGRGGLISGLVDLAVQAQEPGLDGAAKAGLDFFPGPVRMKRGHEPVDGLLGDRAGAAGQSSDGRNEDVDGS